MDGKQGRWAFNGGFVLSEEFVVDCNNCKDLASVRRLVEQMKEGGGRHNSNLEIYPQSPVYDVDDPPTGPIHPSLSSSTPATAREVTWQWRELLTFHDLIVAADRAIEDPSTESLNIEEMQREILRIANLPSASRSGFVPNPNYRSPAQARRVAAPSRDAVKLRMADASVGDLVSCERYPLRDTRVQFMFFRPYPDNSNSGDAYVYRIEGGYVVEPDEWVFELVAAVVPAKEEEKILENQVGLELYWMRVE